MPRTAQYSGRIGDSSRFVGGRMAQCFGQEKMKKGYVPDQVPVQSRGGNASITGKLVPALGWA